MDSTPGAAPCEEEAAELMEWGPICTGQGRPVGRAVEGGRSAAWRAAGPWGTARRVVGAAAVAEFEGRPDVATEAAHVISMDGTEAAHVRRSRCHWPGLLGPGRGRAVGEAVRCRLARRRAGGATDSERSG